MQCMHVPCLIGYASPRQPPRTATYRMSMYCDKWRSKAEMGRHRAVYWWAASNRLGPGAQPYARYVWLSPAVQ